VNLGSYFDDSITNDFELLPGDGLRLKDRLSSSTGLIRSDPTQYVSGALAEKLDAEANDNMWSLQPWLLKSFAGENPGSIKLRIPGGTVGPGVLHDVQILLPAPGNPAAGRTGSFKLSIEGGPQQTYDFGASTGERMVNIGRFDLHDGALDVEVSPVPGIATEIRAFELTAAVGYVESTYFAWKGERGTAELRFDDSSTSAGAVQYALRTGAMGAHEITWSDWAPVAERRAELQLSNDQLLQWRAFVLPEASGPAVIRKVELAPVR
jgi:hypothetical protein